jgi:hypothetical protein
VSRPKPKRTTVDRCRVTVELGDAQLEELHALIEADP